MLTLKVPNLTKYQTSQAHSTQIFEFATAHHCDFCFQKILLPVLIMYTKITKKPADKGIQLAAKQMDQFCRITCIFSWFWTSKPHHLFFKK